MKARRNTLVVALLFGLPLASGQDTPRRDAPRQQTLPPASLERSYNARIQPLLRRYCYECHAADVTEADIDLARFTSLAKARKQPQLWQKVRHMLGTAQMPPKDSPQPTAEEEAQLRTWVRAFLMRVARATAGDPGPVVLRRLGNAEYRYTIRDLTGIAGLDPTREFPVDGAAGEGFTNTGVAQSMSPALVTKYFDAAKQVAEHAALYPEGIRFTPLLSHRDLTDDGLAKLRAFYARYTTTGGGSAVKLQGIKFDTNQGGLLPLGKYLRATVSERDALQAGRKTLDIVASRRQLSPKYLGKLWRVLSDVKSPSLLLDPLRRHWPAAKVEDVPALVAEIARWQKLLWKFNVVGHIGREGAPRSWIESVTPVAARQEFRIKLPKPAGGEDVLIYLSAHDAGDGNEHDYVAWHDMRLEGKGLPTIKLRDIPGLHERQAQWKDKLVVKAPSLIEFRIPAKLAIGREAVIAGMCEAGRGQEGTVQLHVSTTRPNGDIPPPSPIVCGEGTKARKRVEKAFTEFRELFPIAVCYSRIVPVDEVVTATLFHREDDLLRRLLLSKQQSAELDRLWDDLYFVSEEPLKLVVALEQIREFATQDRKDLVGPFDKMKLVVEARAEVFRKKVLATEGVHVESVLDFADRAWRRKLTGRESEKLRQLYTELRADGLSHEAAIRLLIARVLTSPAFLYRGEKQPQISNASKASKAAPVTDLELASRLSYFLWSTMPDKQLRGVAEAGRLTLDRKQDGKTELVRQAQRMLAAPQTRRLAIHFACQWLHVRGYDQNQEKNEKLYPEFAALRGDMYEETVLFFESMFRNDGSVLDMIDCDYTFLNESLAKHYGITEVKGSRWRRVEGIKSKGRGGLLGMASILASQSGASRTSPILRGNWVYETLLGERLPRPPANVPVLPEEVPAGLTARELIQRHSSAAACATCHRRIDPYGFALEQYDAIGRLREQAVDTKSTLLGGKPIEGIAGLREYLARDRREVVVRQFCRKLLGYALGREVQLSDEVLLAEMQEQLARNEYRFGVAVEAIVSSRQFRYIRRKSSSGLMKD